jgi:hypothetical protein
VFSAEAGLIWPCRAVMPFHRRRGTATISSQTASCYRIGTNLRAAIAALLQEGMVSLGMVNRDPNVTPTTTRSHHGPR